MLISFVEGLPHIHFLGQRGLHKDFLCGWAFESRLVMWRGLHILSLSVEGPPHIDSLCARGLHIDILCGGASNMLNPYVGGAFIYEFLM